MNFLDLFSGIGGFRYGMTLAGHTPVGWCEIDKYAQKSYRAMYDTEGEWFADDITRVTDDDIRQLGRERGQIQVITGGFPCQAFSIAGRRGGFTDTRGTLFFEIMRFASILRPCYLFLENVPGLLSHDNGNTFETILRTLDEVGFDVEWDCLNTKDFGPPQNRERIFIVGHSRTECTRKIFPLETGNGKTLEQSGGINNGMWIINDNQGELQFLGDTVNAIDANYYKGLQAHQQRAGVLYIPCLTPDREEKRQNGRRFKKDGEPMFTLTGQDVHGVAIREATKQGFAIAGPGDSINLEQPNSKTRRGRVGKGVAQTVTANPQQATIQDCRIRKLLPIECFRLQGFPDELFYKAKNAGVSDSQLYKQAGNAVSVPVIYAIAKEMV